MKFCSVCGQGVSLGKEIPLNFVIRVRIWTRFSAAFALRSSSVLVFCMWHPAIITVNASSSSTRPSQPVCCRRPSYPDESFTLLSVFRHTSCIPFYITCSLPRVLCDALYPSAPSSASYLCPYNAHHPCYMPIYSWRHYVDILSAWWWYFFPSQPHSGLDWELRSGHFSLMFIHTFP